MVTQNSILESILEAGFDVEVKQANVAAQAIELKITPEGGRVIIWSSLGVFLTSAAPRTVTIQVKDKNDVIIASLGGASLTNAQSGYLPVSNAAFAGSNHIDSSNPYNRILQNGDYISVNCAAMAQNETLDVRFRYLTEGELVVLAGGTDDTITTVYHDVI